MYGSLEACTIGTKARLLVVTHQLAQLNTHLLSNNFIVKQQHGILISPLGSFVFDNFILDIRRGVKNEYFTVRLTVRGGGAAQSAVTISKCENVDPFFH